MTELPSTSWQQGRSHKIIFVASTGGHLAQLVRFSANMRPEPDSLWITSRSLQSESLLAELRVRYLPYVGARDPLGVLRTAMRTRAIIRNEEFDLVVSTGSAFGLGVFLAAAAKRIPRVFIESVSRVQGPSTTGRIVQALHLAKLFTQHPGWSTSRWRPHPPVLKSFAAAPKPDAPGVPKKMFITLGTFRKYRFDSLIDAVLKTGLVNKDTIWQVGDTTRKDLPGTVHREMTAAEFRAASRSADLVVTHAGVGSILDLLEAGIYPVVVARRASKGEHVDDHQTQIAALVGELQIAAAVSPEDLDARVLSDAAALRVTAR